MHDLIKNKKDILRNEILRKRDELSLSERINKSLEIAAGLLRISEIIKSESIFTYVSFRSEVNTISMIEDFISQGKSVCVPFTDMKKKIIIPCAVKSIENDLVKSRLGIPEPSAEKINPVSPDEIDIMIVPGAVFSINGCRIGYGGGYYDRFMHHRAIPSYALAFDFQVFDL